MPMTIAVRDNWEAKQEELEEKLSSLLRCPWKVVLDTNYLYGLACERYAKESPGEMFIE